MPAPTAPRPAAGLVPLVLGDEVVVWDGRRRQAHLLNATAALVLDACDGRTPPAELTAGLAAELGADPAVVDPEVRAALVRLADLGLLVGDEDPPPPSDGDGAQPPARHRLAEATSGSPVAWVAETPVLHLLDARAVVRTDDAEVADYLARTLAPLVPPAGADADRDGATRPTAFEVAVGHGQVPELRIDGEVVGRGPSKDGVLALLHWHLNRLAVDGSPGVVRLHAAAAAGAEGALVLPGTSGAGKSTLVAALVRAGLGYLTDEIVAVDPRTGWVRGCPRPIGLEAGSWPLFPDADPRAGSAPGLFGHEWLVDPLRLHPDASRAAWSPAPVARLVFPQFEPGADTTYLPLSAGRALLRLLANVFETTPLARADVEALAEIARTAPAEELVFGDLKAALAALLDDLSSA